MKLLSSIAHAVAMAFVCSQVAGCLYMKNGSTQQVDFQSEPAGAQVVVNGKQYGATPTTASLSRCETYEVTVQKAGYEPNHITISRGLSGTDSILFFLDSILIVPAIVDRYNCTMTLNPNPVVAQMSPVVSSAPAAAESSQVK